MALVKNWYKLSGDRHDNDRTRANHCPFPRQPHRPTPNFHSEYCAQSFQRLSTHYKTTSTSIGALAGQPSYSKAHHRVLRQSNPANFRLPHPSYSPPRSFPSISSSSNCLISRIGDGRYILSFISLVAFLVSKSSAAVIRFGPSSNSSIAISTDVYLLENFGSRPLMSALSIVPCISSRYVSGRRCSELMSSIAVLTKC